MCMKYVHTHARAKERKLHDTNGPEDSLSCDRVKKKRRKEEKKMWNGWYIKNGGKKKREKKGGCDWLGGKDVGSFVAWRSEEILQRTGGRSRGWGRKKTKYKVYSGV